MKLEALASSLGAQFENNTYRGIIDGYEYQISYAKIAFMKYHFASFILDKPLSDGQLKSIRSEIGRIGLFLSSVGSSHNNVINIQIRKPEKTLERLGKLVQYLKYNSIDLLTTEIYGKTTDITTYREIKINYMRTNYYQYITVPLNEEVSAEMYDLQLEELNREDSENKNLMGGILFAILGAFLGTIPSIVVYHLGYIVWLLYLLVPFLSFIFYKTAKGPQKNYVPFLIGVISVLVSLAALLYAWISVAAANGLTFGELLAIEEMQSALMNDLIFVLIGNIVGVLVSFQYIYKNTTAGRKKALDNLK